MSKICQDKTMKITTNWQYTSEVTPAFKQLMQLLLTESNDNPIIDKPRGASQ